MPNTNCLEGMACPVCGYEDNFLIQVTTWMNVYDDGTDDHTDVNWDATSPCECGECGHRETVYGFATINQEREQVERDRSVNCKYCGFLVSERECVPGPRGEGSVCESCQ